MQLLDVEIRKIETIYPTIYQPIQIEYWQNGAQLEVKFCDPAHPEVKYNNPTDLFQINQDIIYEALENLDYLHYYNPEKHLKLLKSVEEAYYKEIEQQYGADLIVVTAPQEEFFTYPSVRKVSLCDGAIVHEEVIITTGFNEKMVQVVKDKPTVYIGELCHIISAEDLQQIIKSHEISSLELC